MNVRVISSGSIGNCYVINNGTTTLLLEAGIPYKQIQKALDFKISSVDGCLISHEHL